MKIKNLIAFLLAFAMLIGAVACTATGGTDTTAEPGSEAPDATAPESTGSELGSDETTGAENNPIPVGQRLIYYENFNDEDVSSQSEKVLKSLGWVKDTTSNRAYNNNTTDYAIVLKDGSNQLYLKNNKNSGTDSYVIILSSEAMGAYHEKNYTYQYDVNYESSADTARYIVLLSEYNGQFYNSFHLRNNGSANNQSHDSGSWNTYDTAGEYFAASKDANAISKKLLGVNYSESATPLQGLSISIRYQVDWENGNSVYLRLNTEGYPNTGKWILVSKGVKPDDKSAFKPDKGGAAMALKTGSKINGYVDNIVIWEGLGDEPEDKSSPLLTSESKECSGHVYAGAGICSDPNMCRYCGVLSENNTGHDFEAVSGLSDQRCKHCLGFKSSVDSGWLLSKLPAYSGGTQAKKLYRAGHGIKDNDFSMNDDSLMHIVSKTNETQFAAYRDLLVSYGAAEVYNYTCDGNIYYQYDFRGEAYVYTYYTASVKEVRIIYDNQSDCSPEDFGYTYEKKEGETTVFYQYGVPMKDGSPDDGSKPNCGHMYVMKLADNSVFVIDGGSYQQFDTKQIDGFMKFLRSITGTSSNEKIKISWYVSHGHQDHLSGFLLFVKKYHAQLDFDRIFFNIPTVNSDIGVFATANSHKKMIDYIDKYIRDDGVKYIKIHTGQVFNLADAKVSVIYTHEDLVDPNTGDSEIAGDYNNSCSVIKISFDGKELLFLGDVNKPSMNVMIKNNSKETLKSDIVQLSHHVFNDLTALYDIAQASVVLVPQSSYYVSIDNTRKKILNAALKYVENDMVFYANEATYGISVVNGKLEKTFEAPVDGGKHTGWSW